MSDEEQNQMNNAVVNVLEDLKGFSNSEAIVILDVAKQEHFKRSSQENGGKE